MTTFGSVNAAKNWFFDRAEVLKRADAGTLRVLSKMGAYVRTRARSSLRYRKAVSAPGSPPSVRRGWTQRRLNRKTGRSAVRSFSPLREFLYFAFDPARKTTVVGPAAVNGVKGDATPARLEKGGTLVASTAHPIYKPRPPGRDGKGRFVTAGVEVVKAGTVLNYRPRPFMAPAEAAERPRFAPLFKDQFNRAA